MKIRRPLAAVVTVAAAAAVGAVAEEFLFRRLFSKQDPEEHEPFGNQVGESFDVTSFDGVRISGEEFGDPLAPAIIFCHGFSLDRRIWHYQIRDLREHFRLITYDARGHGRSQPVIGAEDLKPITSARDLYEVIQSREITDCVVVGHSMGGMTLQAMESFGERYAETMGKVVRGVVLINTTPSGAMGWMSDRDPGRFRTSAMTLWLRTLNRVDTLRRMTPRDLAMFLSRFGFGRHASRTQVAFASQIASDTPTSTLVHGIDALHRYRAPKRLDAIDVPVLCIAGQSDLLTPPSLAQDIASRFPSAELKILEGCGHMAMLERYGEVNDLIHQFAKEVL